MGRTRRIDESGHGPDKARNCTIAAAFVEAVHLSILLSSARFETTVTDPAHLPGPDGDARIGAAGIPEAAFVGRSNAGKSSAINVLCNRKRLAFSSRTPGRTQALNFFVLGPADAPVVARLVDTPGYGFASAPLAVKRGWDRLAGQYLAQRPALRGVVLVLDIRRGLTALDRELLQWIAADVPLLVLASKADKLAHGQRITALRELGAVLQDAAGPAGCSLLGFSATRRLGVDEARAVITGWLTEDQNPGGDAPADAGKETEPEDA